MSTQMLAALPALAALQASAAKVSRRGQLLRFRFRRGGVSLAGYQSLVDLGIPVRIYSGTRIISIINGMTIERQSPVTRAHVTVEVSL